MFAAIGLNMIHLKAGRTKASDSIDHGVGLTDIVNIGQWIDTGQPLAYAHVRNDDQAQYLQQTLPIYLCSSVKTLLKQYLWCMKYLHQTKRENRETSNHFSTRFLRFRFKC